MQNKKVGKKNSCITSHVSHKIESWLSDIPITPRTHCLKTRVKSMRTAKREPSIATWGDVKHKRQSGLGRASSCRSSSERWKGAHPPHQSTEDGSRGHLQVSWSDEPTGPGVEDQGPGKGQQAHSETHRGWRRADGFRG